jgi:DNA-binding transcriptional MerR regulator
METNQAQDNDRQIYKGDFQVLTDPGSEAEPERLSSIRDMARDFGVSIRTLRFYEDRGLLHPHRQGTVRYYSGRDRHDLKMILKGKQLGFTLAEIHEMLASRDEKSGKADLELGLLPEQIIAQINHLERQRNELDEAILALRNAHQRLVGSSHHSVAS